jgi:type II secretory pathway component PulC
VNKLVNFNWNLAATTALFLCGCLISSNSFAKSFYKSVDANGKITYSNHPTAKSQTAQNISLLKDSPKFSVSKQAARSTSKS